MTCKRFDRRFSRGYLRQIKRIPLLRIKVTPFDFPALLLHSTLLKTESESPKLVLLEMVIFSTLLPHVEHETMKKDRDTIRKLIDNYQKKYKTTFEMESIEVIEKEDSVTLYILQENLQKVSVESKRSLLIEHSPFFEGFFRMNDPEESLKEFVLSDLPYPEVFNCMNEYFLHQTIKMKDFECLLKCSVVGEYLLLDSDWKLSMQTDLKSQYLLLGKGCILRHVGKFKTPFWLYQFVMGEDPAFLVKLFLRWGRFECEENFKKALEGVDYETLTFQQWIDVEDFCSDTFEMVPASFLLKSFCKSLQSERCGRCEKYVRRIDWETECVSEFHPGKYKAGFVHGWSCCGAERKKCIGCQRTREMKHKKFL